MDIGMNKAITDVFNELNELCLLYSLRFTQSANTHPEVRTPPIIRLRSLPYFKIHILPTLLLHTDITCQKKTAKW